VKKFWAVVLGHTSLPASRGRARAPARGIALGAGRGPGACRGFPSMRPQRVRARDWTGSVPFATRKTAIPDFRPHFHKESTPGADLELGQGPVADHQELTIRSGSAACGPIKKPKREVIGAPLGLSVSRGSLGESGPPRRLGLNNRPVLTARDMSSLREPHGPLAVP
jgi:hypothetical protein